MQIANMAMSIGIALDPSGKAQKSFERELKRTMADTKPSMRTVNPMARPMYGPAGKKTTEPMRYGPKHKWGVIGVRAAPTAASEAALKRMQADNDRG